MARSPVNGAVLLRALTTSSMVSDPTAATAVAEVVLVSAWADPAMTVAKRLETAATPTIVLRSLTMRVLSSTGRQLGGLRSAVLPSKCRIPVR